MLRLAPMKLTEKDISRFQDLYRLRFGKEISRERAEIEGKALLALVKAGCKAETELLEGKGNEARK
jgi:hypothetical protein